MSDEAGSVELTATVMQWTEDRIDVQYTLQNNSALELIVFDVDDQLISDVVNDVPRIFKGKIETPNIDFVSQPLIEGRNLSPEQSVTGVGTIDLPLQFEFITPALEPASPSTVEFCIGHGNADDVLPLTRPDGSYTLNTNVELQTLACVSLTRA